MPDCFARVQVLKYIFHTDDHEMWDLSDRGRTHRLLRAGSSFAGFDELLLDSVDGILLIQVWPHLNLPEVIREAWQPVIDAATASQDMPPRDPAGFSARIARRDRRRVAASRRRRRRR